MKDIELPPLPVLGPEWTPHWTKVVHDKMQAYARAAVEADRTQRVPDWAHPKVQALIGSDARKRIQIDLMWRILENPNDEFGPSDMEYWDTIHDRLKAAMLASTPAPAPAPAPAQQEPDWKAMYEHEKRRSAMWIAKYEKDIGPLECVVPVSHQEQPQQERGPTLTEDDLIEAFCSTPHSQQFVSVFIAGARFAERHHGIRKD